MSKTSVAASHHFSLPKYDTNPRVYVIHENEEWLAPLWDAFSERKIPYRNWFLNDGALDLNSRPPEGIFYNRLSASAHARGHRYANEMGIVLIQWLEQHGRKVINGGGTLHTELNKAKQYQLLKAYNIPFPKTIVINNEKQAKEISPSLDYPFILKPNRGGKGLGVSLIEEADDLNHINWNASIDGIWLLQEYVAPPEGQIVRMEFIGGKFYYAVAVSTTEGFELCPADTCEIPEAGPKFSIIDDADNPLIPQIEKMMVEQQIDVAGIEYVQDATGKRWVYDINTNTNYNIQAEVQSGLYSGMKKLAAYLENELKQITK